MDAASFRDFASNNSTAFRDAVELALNEKWNHPEISLVILNIGGGLYVLLFYGKIKIS